MYIYQADMFCDECGEKIKSECVMPNYPEPWDTDDYPDHWPESNNGTDTPSHCGACGCPIECQLTEDGVRYVLEAIRESLQGAVDKGRAVTWDRVMPMPGTAEEDHDHWKGHRHVEIVRGWAELLDSYSLEKDEAAIVGLFLDLSRPLK